MLTPLIINKALLEGKSGAQTPGLSPSTVVNQPTNLSKSNNLQGFSYPNSKLISSDQRNLILESTDQVTVITNWYKQKIHSQGMKTTSFIETSTNGEILNQLVGANGVDKIAVSISKTAAKELVRIELISYD